MKSNFLGAAMCPKMRLRGMAVAAMLLSPACVVFADRSAEILIERTDGKTLTLPISTAVKITQDGKILKITTAGVEKTVAISEIAGISYKETESDVSVDKITDIPDLPHFSFNGKNLLVVGLDDGETVNIFSIDGRLMHTATYVRDASNQLSVATGRFADGIYIAKTNRGTFKFMKR